MTEPTPAPGGHRRAELTGYGLMVVAMALLGLVPTGARLAYDGGGSPETASVLRHGASFIFVGLALALGARRRAGGFRALALPRRAVIRSIGLGIVLAVFAWAYFAAVRYIPVSLAVLLLYTFPAQAILMTAFLGMERLTRARGAAFAVAFGGVALAVGVGGATPDWRGVGLALLAALGLALTTVLGSRLISRGVDALALTFYMGLVAAAATATVVAVGPGFAWPTGAVAWGGYLFAGSAAGLGLVLYFLALRLIGPVRASLWSNLEPVVAILAAIAILGERPSPARFAGIALVLAAIGLLYIFDRRAAASRNSAKPVDSTG